MFCCCILPLAYSAAALSPDYTPARISRCRLEGCDPYCIFIKGRSDALITACQFVYAGKSAKSPWAQAYGGLALPAAGE
jgi:hypothetical protein